MSAETAFLAVDWLIEQARDEKKITITFFGASRC